MTTPTHLTFLATDRDRLAATIETLRGEGYELERLVPVSSERPRKSWVAVLKKLR